VRAVRWSASGVFDAHGRVRGWMSAIDDTDGVMVARVPVGRISTLASALGDAPVALAAAVLIALLGLASRRRARDAVAASGRE
jgi:apolipoprotein N-acyltransferase